MRYATQFRLSGVKLEPLFAIGNDDDESSFVGTHAECLDAYPDFNPDGDESGSVFFGEIERHLGYLIDPASADARLLYRVFTGAVDAPAGDVRTWLEDSASHMPHLRSALAFIAHMQGAISDENLSQLLREAKL